MEKEIKKRTLSKKIFLFGILPLLLLGTVFAVGYVVSNLVLTVGVAEPFTVEYAVLGDGGNYVSQTCENAQWFTADSSNLPTGNMYAGESRFVCVKINNLAEAIIPYYITNTVTGADGLYNQTCMDAFSKPELTGSVGALGELTTGTSVNIDAGATPVEGCIVNISVGRGTPTA